MQEKTPLCVLVICQAHSSVLVICQAHICMHICIYIAYHQIAKMQAGKYFALFYDADTNTNSESGLVAILFKACSCKDITS